MKIPNCSSVLFLNREIIIVAHILFNQIEILPKKFSFLFLQLAQFVTLAQWMAHTSVPVHPGSRAPTVHRILTNVTPVVRHVNMAAPVLIYLARSDVTARLAFLATVAK